MHRNAILSTSLNANIPVITVNLGSIFCEAK